MLKVNEPGTIDVPQMNLSPYASTPTSPVTPHINAPSTSTYSHLQIPSQSPSPNEQHNQKQLETKHNKRLGINDADKNGAE